MKKVFFLLIAALFIAAGCSVETSENGENSNSEMGSLDKECYPNETCNKGLVCDTEHNVCVKDNNKDEDTDPEDVPSDGTDTAPEDGSDDGNSEPEGTQGYTESKYEDHALFNGHGVLFDYSTEYEYEEKKGNVEGTLDVVFGGESYDFDLISAFIYPESEVVIISAEKMVDKETGTTLMMSVYLFESQIEKIRKFGADLGYEDEVDFAPQITFYKNRHFEEEGFAYSKYLAAGKQSKPVPELAGGLYSDGRMMLFLDENLNIAAGEDFRLSFDVDITDETEEVEEIIYGDLGQCYDLESGEEIDCPEDIETKAGF